MSHFSVTSLNIVDFVQKKAETFRPNLFLQVTYALLYAVLLIELIDTTTCLSSLLCTCVEGMALGADFYVNLLLGRTCYELISTVADNLCLIIIRMNSCSHFQLSFSIRPDTFPVSVPDPI